jgi:hypothetical protein
MTDRFLSIVGEGKQAISKQLVLATLLGPLLLERSVLLGVQTALPPHRVVVRFAVWIRHRARLAAAYIRIAQTLPPN